MNSKTKGTLSEDLRKSLNYHSETLAVSSLSLINESRVSGFYCPDIKDYDIAFYQENGPNYELFERIIHETTIKSHSRIEFKQVDHVNNACSFLRGNSIVLQYPKLPSVDWGTELFLKQRLLLIRSQFRAENRFWGFNENEEKYAVLSPFVAFMERECPEKMASAYYLKSRFNQKAWLDYIVEVLQNLFSDYKSKRTGSESLILFKEVGPFQWILDVDLKSINIELNHGSIELGVIKLYVKSETLASKYPEHDFGDIGVHLGIFANPFFFEPAMPLIGYAAVANSKNIEDPTDLSLKYAPNIHAMNGNKVRITYSEEFGDILKRHVFYYYSILHHTSKSYLEYLGNSISTILS